MKKIICLSVVVFFCLSALSQKRHALVDEIATFKTNVAKNATYKLSYDELWDNLYIVMTSNYSIAKESKTKGYIVSEKISKTEYNIFGKPSVEYKDFVAEAEILGDTIPYRIVLKLEGEKRTYNSYDSTWTAWATFRNYKAEDNLRVQLHEKIYGKIEIPSELVTRIETYNLKEKKDKNKILQGRDY